MKNRYVIIVSAILISVGSFAQKDEMKTLKKIYDKDLQSPKDIAEYKEALIKAEPLIVNGTEADKIYFNYFKATTPFMELQQAMSKPENKTNQNLTMQFFNIQNINLMATSMSNVVDFEKKYGKQIYTKDVEEGVGILKPILINYAVSLGDKSQYKEAASILKSIYDLDKKDQEKLYYAASYAINAKDYDLALQFYNELKTLNYSGESTTFYAFNKETKKEDSFNSKSERDIYIKTGTYEKPRDEKNPSKRGEIYKNIALILLQNGKTDEAKTAIKEARTANPDDASLILTEADLYYKLNDLVTYKKLINEALEKNPNDVDLLFNLGVISRKANLNDDAEKYFKKVIEINPNYTNSYLNLAELKLSYDDKFVNEMNKLTTSEKDTKRYNIIKTEREKMFKDTLPFLEKAYELDSKNEAVSSTLLGVYKALEMSDKVKELKAKM